MVEKIYTKQNWKILSVQTKWAKMESLESKELPDNHIDKTFDKIKRS
jgi:hypothetical protein